MTLNSKTNQSSVKCKYCGKELPTQNFAPFGLRPMLITLPCDCEQSQAELAEERERNEQEERIRAFSEVWSRSDVPERFLHVKADFNIARPLFDGRWLYLCGRNGVGKTHAACQAAKAYLVRSTKRDVIRDSHGERLGSMRCQSSFHFTGAQSLLSEVTSSWSRWDMSEEEVKSRMVGVDLLILDDLGKGVPSEWAAETLFDVINRRWSGNVDGKRRLTIVTSQYDITELSERYRKAGAETLSAMVSRLRGECEEIRMEGQDRRLAQVI